LTCRSSPSKIRQLSPTNERQTVSAANLAGQELSLYRNFHAIFQRNDPTGRSPNSSPENNLPPN
jgi:hypothetical protein